MNTSQGGRGQSVTEVMASLSTEADRVRGFWRIFGFGNRVIVRPDEVHVVVGHGIHSWAPSKETSVFGQTAGAPSIYWLNANAQVVKLRTYSFTVEISGEGERGIELLDKHRVSFRAWAHVEAKLDSSKALVAAQRVGTDVSGLVHSIISETTTQLIVAAASMSLDEIIANMQRLGDVATDRVNTTLAELGYDLAFLRVIRLAGDAYDQIVRQATAEVTAQTTIGINAAELTRIEDDNARTRRESELTTATTLDVKQRELRTQRDVETATNDQRESLAAATHQLRLAQVERDQTVAQREHSAALAQIALDGERLTAQQTRDIELARSRAVADAEKDRAVQTAQIQLQSEATTAQTAIDRQRDLAAAEREKEVRLISAGSAAETERIAAESQAVAQSITTRAQTEAQLAQARAQAESATITAQAALVEANATRAREAASGLAAAEIAAAQVAVDQKRVEVVRAEGLAQVEIDRARQAASIEAQRLLATLYAEAPVLVDLERIRMDHTLQLELARLQAETRLEAFKALAPQLDVRLFGNGGQMSQLINQLLSLSEGASVVGHEIPVIGNLFGSGGSPESTELWSSLVSIMARVRGVLGEIDPRVFSNLSLADALEQVEQLMQGETDVVSAINRIRERANFQLIGSIPIGGILSLLGLNLNENGSNRSVDIQTIPVVAK
ncbi:hypothetical protein HGA91_03385 [candidate division WWE3 bacterium]|nr:hypothetical protein [candidate division WWE3 bacterium]